MSLSSMANISLDRKDPNTLTPRNYAETVRAAAGQPENESIGTTALAAISAYIPTETIAIYVAALAAVKSESTDPSQVPGGELVAFWLVLLATPAIVWMVFASKYRAKYRVVPWGTWPIWEMVAATIGFAAWSFALPDSVWRAFDWYTPALGSVVILVTSTMLGLASGVFTKSK